MSQRSVPLVGLIGGIGSGKSTVADLTAKMLRGVRIDADATGHAALQQPAIKRRVRAAFGAEVFDENNQVIRANLAAKVFGSDAASIENRAVLNSIVHPWIRMRHLAEIERLADSDECNIILLDAAVLLEAGWGELCDVIVFIDVPESIRLQRVASRGWTSAELQRREASQLPLDEKRAKSHFVVDNSKTAEFAATQLASFLTTRFQLHSHSSDLATSVV